MAHHKSALKRIRQTKKLKIANRQKRKTLKLAIREVHTSTMVEAAGEKLKSAQSILDKMAVRGLLHKNNAAKKLSRLAKSVNALKS
ncbi:MAG: ribosomal protein [Ignavibacteria bacterium]|nr:ribosomal protein [Ignavibacteria bacterium]